MEILDPIVKPYRIVTFKKDLDKVKLKNLSITLMRGTILEYWKIKK